MSDSFLSEEDLDLKNLTFEELILEWNAWLDQAQANNEFDKGHYSHACFGYEMPKVNEMTKNKKTG